MSAASVVPAIDQDVATPDSRISPRVAQFRGHEDDIRQRAGAVRVCVPIPTLRLKGVCVSTFEQTSQSRLISTCSLGPVCVWSGWEL